jgi:hypothetical protein
VAALQRSEASELALLVEGIGGIMRLRIIAGFTVLGWGCAVAAGAQFAQYTAPGGLGLPSVGSREALEKGMAEAPWRLGRLRVQPWLGLRDVAYVENIFIGPEGSGDSDLTATVGLGIKAYQPVGPKIILAAHLMPEYVWWQDHGELAGWHYRHGLGAFGFFNHLTAEAKVTATQQQQYVTSEFASIATLAGQNASLDLSVDLNGPLSFFAGASASDLEYDDDGVEPFFPADLSVLDRQEQVLRGGLAYKRRSGFRFGLGYEQSEVDFDDTRRDRSNSGGGPLLVVGYDGARMSTAVDLVHRELEEERGSDFRRFRDLSGTARLTFKTGARLNPSFYGSRQLVYSLQPESSYFADERAGLSLEQVIGWRTSLRVFGEVGRNDYVQLSGAAPDRTDDYLGYGGEVQFKIRERLTALIGAVRSEYDSNLAGFDRDLTSIRLSVTFGGGYSPW